MSAATAGAAAPADCGKTGVAVTFSKTRYRAVEAALLAEGCGESEVGVVMRVLREVLGFDPDVSSYTPARASAARAWRGKAVRCAECGLMFTTASIASHAQTHKPGFQQRCKREEERVAKLLTKAGIDFKREHAVDFRCLGDSPTKSAHIDFVIITGGRVIFLEVDEGQHKFGYTVSCDMARMARIVETLALEGNTLPVRFVRYNPHAFTVGGEPHRVPQDQREAALLRTLAEVAAGGSEPLGITYLYYDCERAPDGALQLCVHADPDYSEHIRQCCAPAVLYSGCS